ncbi:MAG: hypothetical protein A3J97_04705 [Spirochaetes bacterium RIFOXYC1_FULL_54_7]|nr:MAG: hypothetical protein A3J97_04705 [Spirochaetes bacterium RIFOXYC1_FULL_54_7]
MCIIHMTACLLGASRYGWLPYLLHDRPGCVLQGTHNRHKVPAYGNGQNEQRSTQLPEAIVALY